MRMMTYQYSDGDIDLHYDYIFVQRCPEIFVKGLSGLQIVDNIKWVPCYHSNGICTIQPHSSYHIETFEMKDFVIEANKSQGKQYQILYLPNKVKIINASISYEDDDVSKNIYLSQTKEVLDLIDDNTLLVADLHYEDIFLPEEVKLEPRGLINHASNINSFQCPPQNGGQLISLQKIITTKNSNINVSNVRCNVQDIPYGHSPLEFEI